MLMLTFLAFAAWHGADILKVHLDLFEGLPRLQWPLFGCRAFQDAAVFVEDLPHRAGGVRQRHLQGLHLWITG